MARLSIKLAIVVFCVTGLVSFAALYNPSLGEHGGIGPINLPWNVNTPFVKFFSMIFGYGIVVHQMAAVAIIFAVIIRMYCNTFRTTEQ